MTDIQIEEIVEEMGLATIPKMILDFDPYGKALFKESQRFMWDRIRNSSTNTETELGNVLSFLDWKGLKHTDMHAGNFMRDKEGNIYIIDFGNVNIK